MRPVLDTQIAVQHITDQIFTIFSKTDRFPEPNGNAAGGIFTGIKRHPVIEIQGNNHMKPEHFEGLLPFDPVNPV